MQLDIIKNGMVRATFEDIGEGRSGDYDPTDPNDVALMRFTISKYEDDGWQDVDDASYCTNWPVPAGESDEGWMLNALIYILYTVYDDVVRGDSIKKVCEILSWTGPDNPYPSTYSLHRTAFTTQDKETH